MNLFGKKRSKIKINVLQIEYISTPSFLSGILLEGAPNERRDSSEVYGY